jgi:hypothetical protein
MPFFVVDHSGEAQRTGTELSDAKLLGLGTQRLLHGHGCVPSRGAGPAFAAAGSGGMTWFCVRISLIGHWDG